RNRLKILVWEPGGFWLLARRLERGTFAWPKSEASSIELTPAQLAVLLGGLDPGSRNSSSVVSRLPALLVKDSEELLISFCCRKRLAAGDASWPNRVAWPVVQT